MTLQQTNEWKILTKNASCDSNIRAVEKRKSVIWFNQNFHDNINVNLLLIYSLSILTLNSNYFH